MRAICKTDALNITEEIASSEPLVACEKASGQNTSRGSSEARLASFMNLCVGYYSTLLTLLNANSREDFKVYLYYTFFEQRLGAMILLGSIQFYSL